MIYGAGDVKLGDILSDLPGDLGKELGNETGGSLTRQRMMKNLPGYGKLVERIHHAIKKKWIMGLDGRKLYVRHEHAALNTLLQSAGSIVVKAATVYADVWLTKRKVPARQVLHMHDEAQYEHRPGYHEHVVKAFVDGLKWAEKHYKVRCPLDGNGKLGTNWKETH